MAPTDIPGRKMEEGEVGAGDNNIAFFSGNNGGGGGILTTFEPCLCSFCSVELKISEGVVLDGCLHNFCRDCLIVAIEGSTSPQIPCPVHDCGGVLLDPEIKALVSTSSFQRYLNRSLKLLVMEENTGAGDVGVFLDRGRDLNLVPCRSPGCSGVGDGSLALEFKCGDCAMINCLLCKKVRDGSIERCKCLVDEEDGIQPAKKARIEIDPDVAKDWEAKWKLLSASVASNTDPAGGQTSSDALLAMTIGMNESQLLISQQEFDCPICFCRVEKGDGVILKDCFHSFCRDCLTGVIEHSEGATVSCPHRINDDVCHSTISDREIKSLVSPQFYETFLRRSVTSAELGMKNTFHCQTVNCESFWEMDYAEMEGEVACPSCKKRNCLKCKAVHEAVSCEEYKARLSQDEMDIKTKALIQKKVNKGLVMKCPTCKVMIEKNGGCSHMHCAFCNTHFNWEKARKNSAGQNETANSNQLFVPVARGGWGPGRGAPIPQTYQGYFRAGVHQAFPIHAPLPRQGAGARGGGRGRGQGQGRGGNGNGRRRNNP